MDIYKTRLNPDLKLFLPLFTSIHKIKRELLLRRDECVYLLTFKSRYKLSYNYLAAKRTKNINSKNVVKQS